jgi:nickel/cobalt exporter
MAFDNLFWVAFQSSLILGLVHGVNPCGHSWLVLAPFVVGQKRGGRIVFWTIAFLAGTTAACLLLGLTLGAVSTFIPPALERWVKIGTGVLLLALGGALLIKPDLLHHHEKEPGHEPPHDHSNAHCCGHHHHHLHHRTPPGRTKAKLTGLALFGIGFVNMIIPCPTVAIMYGYALDSGSSWKATAIFGIYAGGTAAAVGCVVFAIYHVARLLEKLSRNSVESALMRSAGLVTVLFAAYSLFTHLP